MNPMVFWKNLFHMGKYDLLAELNDCQRQLQAISERLLFHDLMDMLRDGKHPEFLEELRYMESVGKAVRFPYPMIRPPETVETGRDSLPYVLHKGHKLYFPKRWTNSRVEWQYRHFIERENLTGEGYLSKAPHQYQSHRVHVQAGDVVVDIGAAEGLFSLDVAERASKIYLFENDASWYAPLKKTFAPYREKTVLIPKTVADRDTRSSIRLANALKGEQGKRMFVKMDIEGAEISVLKASKDFLQNEKNLKLACCTYHRANDAEIMEKFFNELGYSTEFSDGFTLTLAYKLEYPYFRRGVLCAFREECASISPL